MASLPTDLRTTFLPVSRVGIGIALGARGVSGWVTETLAGVLRSRGPGFGIDIDPACARFDGDYGSVRIGSQADSDFLQGVVQEIGGVDIVIDDGRHVMKHIKASFETLFPLLSEGGLYVVEDLHTAYLPSFGGGYRSRRSFIETAKDLVDDMHHWYQRRRASQPFAKDQIAAVHFYDSMIVFEKRKVEHPTSVLVGG